MLLILGCGCGEFNYVGLVVAFWGGGGTVSLVHLPGWNAISQSVSHRAAEFRSCWSLRQSSCVLISLYMMLSSAKSLNLLCDRYSGKSFM
jgi:hypothetical protein